MFAQHRSFDLSTGIKGTTIAVFNDGITCQVLYHKTVVVEADKRRVCIKTGGWDTISTRTVINTALRELNLPWMLVRHKGETFLVEDRDIGFSRVLDRVPFNGTAVIQRMKAAS